MMSHARLLPVLPVLLMAVACGGPGAPEPAPLPLTAVLSPASGSAGGRLVQVTLSSTGPTYDLRDVRLRGAGFEQVPAQPATGQVRPGNDVNADLAYGPVLCAGTAAPTVVVVDAASGPVEVPVTGDSLLPGLRAAECAQGG